MVRTIWDWLEIEATHDKTLIRKAYASQAKKYHPEDMPKEAEQLRVAYKKALAYADRYQSIEDSLQDADHGEENTGEDDAYRDEAAEILLQYSDAVFEYEPETQRKERLVPQENPESHYRYHLDVQGEEYKKTQGPGRFDYFRFAGDRAERLELLEKRLNTIYHSGGQSYSDLWLAAFRKGLTEEDLKDSKVVAAILSILIRMHRLSYPVWDALEQELFRCRGEGAEWVWLQTQFGKMRKEDNSFKNLRGPVKQKGNVNLWIDPKTGKMLPMGPVPKEYDSVSEILAVLIGVLAFFMVLFFICGL